MPRTQRLKAGIVFAMTIVLVVSCGRACAQVLDLKEGSKKSNEVTGQTGLPAGAKAPSENAADSSLSRTGPATPDGAQGAQAGTSSTSSGSTSSTKGSNDTGSGASTTQPPLPASDSAPGPALPASAAGASIAPAAATTAQPSNSAEHPPATVEPIKKTVKSEIDEIDADRSKLISLLAQATELILPLPQLQQQVSLLERLAGRTNPNVVVLYNIITTFHYRRAFANGQYAEAAKMCRWMLDTEEAAKSSIDDFFAAHTQIQLADLDRQLGNYKESLSLLERSVPMLSRGNRAAQKLVRDLKTLESPADKERSAAGRAKAKQLIASKQKYYDVLNKQLAETRYQATELGDLYFLMASDYSRSGNEAKAAEYLALARSHGVSLNAKNRSFDHPGKGGAGGPKGPGKAGAKSGVKRSGAAKAK